MNQLKLLRACYALAITTFLSFFIAKALLAFQIAIKTKSIIIGLLSALGIIISLFYTKSSISIGIMMSSIIGILYIMFLYFDEITVDLKFFIALALLIVAIYSLYKIIKK